MTISMKFLGMSSFPKNEDTVFDVEENLNARMCVIPSTQKNKTKQTNKQTKYLLRPEIRKI
jgi:hypothetical protein